MFSPGCGLSTYTYLRCSASAAERNNAAQKKILKRAFSCLVGGDICDKITKDLYKIVKKYNLKQVKYEFYFKILI